MVDHLLGAETDSSSSGNPNRKLKKKKKNNLGSMTWVGLIKSRGEWVLCGWPV